MSCRCGVGQGTVATDDKGAVDQVMYHIYWSCGLLERGHDFIRHKAWQ
ncbi:hypothetical protein SORBI_3001G274700 [Sorghum bicolor]|uniref:Uncharacterized protein n=1 Tax=Sorghum bicolor TaxID=4558 RepID=A0A1B6QLE9_SORBI|nr:hypothetical protein SORBI_3001G274700 [Sorghum bicolor]